MRGHYGPYPGPTLKKILDGGTLFTEVRRSGGQVALANAFPPGYFAALEAGKLRVNVPVYAAQRAGVPLLTLADYHRGEAISADLDGRYLHGLDARSAPQSPEKAGKTLADLAQRATLTFFDFWLSDTAGHRWSFADTAALLEKFDAFLTGLVPALGEVTLLLTSDHGNLEDKSSRSHTRNAVPLLIHGPLEPHFAGATSLLDVAPAVRRALNLRALPS